MACVLRLLSLGTFLALAVMAGPVRVFAQPPAQRPPPATPAEVEEDAEDEETGDEEPRLRPPSIGPLEVGGSGGSSPGSAASEEEEEESTEEEEGGDEDQDSTPDEEQLPSPGAADRRLGSGGNPTIEPWTTPQTVFEVHGYMRMRGEFQDQFSLGRDRGDPRTPDLPFELFIPRDDASRLGGAPAGGCAGGRAGTTSSPCNQRALASANMRLRIEPSIHLSDDVRVRMQLDLFDNLVMGSTPEGWGSNSDWGTGHAGGAGYPSLYTPLTTLATTQAPPTAGVNSWTNSIVVRRAWAEVRNRGLGELRFGRMPNHWGLGMLANGGAGIDSDYQSDVDRIMAITRLVGLYFFGAWDFASEGYVYQNPFDYRVPFDAGRNDDVDQMTFGVMRRSSPEEQQAALQRGEAVLNGGIFFVYRTQNLTSEGTRNPLDPNTQPVLFRRGFEVFVPDIWGQFLFENLRLEVEAVMLIGTIDNMALGQMPGYTPGQANTILQFGAAFEGEYHLLNNQLGIYFNTGYATGDADIEGLTTADGNAHPQLSRPGGADRNLTAFSFHPNYRIDLIFWRTIMRQFGSAYYFRPGLSYDFIRTSFGQLLGARGDVVWSRASESVQTWGNQPDIGLEIDLQAYYRSEDGPDLLDGFYAAVHYGIFFPFGALGYLNPPTAGGQGGQNAQTLRLVLGVQY